MTTIVHTLREDHRNALALLAILDREIARFGAADHPDYDLIQSVLQYFAEYPGRYHHPLEDAVYARLQLRDPAAANRIGDLQHEHEILADARRRLAEAVDSVVADMAVPRHQLVELGREYVDLYCQHMEREEAAFLPATDAALGPDDWADARVAAGRPDDPLFEGGGAEKYRQLRSSIQRMAG